MSKKYRQLIVEVTSVVFAETRYTGKYYVKVSTNKDNQLQTTKLFTSKYGYYVNWKQGFVFVVPSNENSCALRFEIYCMRDPLFRDSLVGIAEYKLDEICQELEGPKYDSESEYESGDSEYDTASEFEFDDSIECHKTDIGDQEYNAHEHQDKSRSNGEENAAAPYDVVKVSASLDIWKRKVSKGKLNVKMVFGKTASIIGDFEWRRFGMKYQDFKMEKASGKKQGGCIAPLMCFTPI